MSARTTEYRDVIDHLPNGATVVFQNVPWEEYEGLLEELDDRPGLRVTYNEGRLEIVSPHPEHERYKEFVLRLAVLLSEELEIPLESFGSTTWKRKKLRKGTEPDTCFYLTNLEHIIGKQRISLESDPPPDIVVEIDTTNDSLRKFPIYAAFGVPEIWRYDGERIQMYERTSDSTYAEITVSRFLPRLTCTGLAEALESSKTLGHTKALKAFRQRIKSE